MAKSALTNTQVSQDKNVQTLRDGGTAVTNNGSKR